MEIISLWHNEYNSILYIYIKKIISCLLSGSFNVLIFIDLVVEEPE